MNDAHNVPNDQSDGAQVQSQLARRVSTLYKEVDTILEELRVPEKEKKEIEQNLMSAVSADLLTRLGSRLSEEQRAEFTKLAETMDKKEPDLEMVANFFRETFSQEDLVNEVASATESVLKEFITEMDR